MGSLSSEMYVCAVGSLSSEMFVGAVESLSQRFIWMYLGLSAQRYMREQFVLLALRCMCIQLGLSVRDVCGCSCV